MGTTHGDRCSNHRERETDERDTAAVDTEPRPSGSCCSQTSAEPDHAAAAETHH